MKKFLSLVLALIMTMSLVTISAGATEYRDLTDKDEIQYEEAVAVLNRIGVITGYEDGSFRPETELTRGAAAKIIVSLMIGPDAASALPNNASPYPDVPAGHTFAGVIGYCKTAEYISGYGDGTFKPANPLTGYAFAKMLLGAIGYKSNIEGFVDTGWTMNVARIGNVAGLFDRISFDGAKAVTRDEACQLALNTLKATMVDYGNANTVVSSSGEVLTVQGSKAQYVTSNNRDINANINRRVINAANNEMTLEFGEEHFKDLRLEHDRYDPAYDVYGHPSNEWSYKKVTIGTFKLPADFTFTKQMAHLEDTVATKEKALGLRGYDTYSTDHKGGYVNWSTAASNQYYSSPFADATQIHINGWNARVRNDDYKQTAVPKGESAKQGNWYTYDARSIDSSSKDLAPSLSELCDLTDNGVTVEVYVCPVDADFITDVVVTRTQLMEVDRVASDFVELDTIDSDSKDPRKDGKLTEIAGYNDYALYDEVISVKDNNYDAYNVLKDLKSGDEVAIIPYTADDGKTWEVGEAYVPETVSGALTNVDIYNTKSKPDGNAVAITVGGTTYPIAQWNKDMREITGVKIRATKKDVTLLLDKMGNALLAKDVGNSNSWIIVGDYYQATLSSGRVGWFVHGWTIKGDEVDLELGTIRGAAEKYAPGELVKYDVASGGNGEYELTKPLFTDNKYTGGKRVLKNGELSPWTEPQGGKDGTKQTGEGIYNIAQFAVQNKASQEFEIKSNNALLPLEFYNTEDSAATSEANATGGHFNYKKATASPDVPVGTNSGECGLVSRGDAGFYGDKDRFNTWTYRAAPYDGVKFIFVGFDATNGEVEVVNVLDGVQSVAHSELTHINRWWKNVGTNDDSFVASPAEAYVDKDGKVKAVVIKSDSAEANLKDLMIITDNKGANTSTKGGAEAPTSGTYYTRQYVSGEDGFKEEKTGYFDKALLVGDVVTGTLQSSGVIRAKSFHARTYTDRNPDGIYVRGIKPLKTQEDVKSKTMFYVGPENGGGTIAYLGTGVSGYGDLTKATTTPAILTDYQVMGLDMPYNFEGLVTVDSSTQFIDLRDGRPGDIDELSDLFDGDKCDNSTVELKILLNGNKDSGSFRHAYVVMVLNAKPSVDGSGSSDGKVNGTAVSTSYKINERSGVVVYTVKADRPDWVPNDAAATVTVTGTVYVDDIPYAISNSKAAYDKNRNLSITDTIASYEADADSEVRIVIDEVRWNCVNVTLDAPEGVSVNPATVPTSTSGSESKPVLTLTLPNESYRSGKVVVTQNGKTLLDKNLAAGDFIVGSRLLTLPATTEKVGIEGAVEVKVTLQTEVFDVGNTGPFAEEARNDAPKNGSGVSSWVKENLDPGVYVLEGLKKGNNSGGWTDPFDQLCDSRDTRVFVYQRNGETGAYTLKITQGNTNLFTEATGSISGDATTEKSLFNVQVGTKYSDVFHNSGTTGTNGSMAGNGTPINGQSANWEITSPSGVVLARGTIEVEPVVSSSSNTIGAQTITGSQVSGTVEVPEEGEDGRQEALNQNADAIRDFIKDSYADGAHVFPDISALVPDTANTSLWIGGSNTDNRLFKFTAGEAGNYTFVLYDANATYQTVLHRETITCTAGQDAFFFICVTGDGAQYNGTSSSIEGSVALNHALSNGTYHWEIRSAESGIVIQGDMAIS